jgi:hypothetical protein
VSSRGLCFLANDRVWDLAIAFLNSVRLYNPTLPICFIPFDNKCGKIVGLQREYEFSVYEDNAVLARCDAISRRFHGETRGHYRKLAAWDCGFDEFIYIDTDTVVLGRLDSVFLHLGAFDFLALSSDSPTLEKWVWKPSIRKTGWLTASQRGYAANTGFVASRRGALSLETAEEKAKLAARLAPHMALDCHEQPFLNYLIVTSGRPFSSLSTFARSGSRYRIGLEYWAGRRGATVENGQLVPPEDRRAILLVHWAGEWQPRRGERLWRWLSDLGNSGSPEMSKVFGVRKRMPYRSLWEHYRWLRSS